MPPEEYLRFANTICDEIASHPEIWVREKKDLAAVAARLDELDAPPMEVIPGTTIERLGRFPAYGELDEHGQRYTLTLRQLLELETDQKKINIHFLSHVRHSDESVDDERGSKASMVVGFTNYERRTYDKTTYWWIDSVCSDASRAGTHTALLPLYIAASEVVAFFDTDTDDERYLSRAWTRLEVLLSAALGSPRSWRLSSPKSRPPLSAQHITLLDPVEGELSREIDREYVKRLTLMAKEMWKVGYACNWHSESNKYRDWQVPEELVPGVTQVYRWNMNHFFTPQYLNPDRGSTFGILNFLRSSRK